MKETKQWLYVLGTGHATVTRCYNTCFAINGEDGGYFLIDAGGGNGILSQLQKMEIPVEKIRSLFVTHMHTDHVLGVVWMMRMAATAALKGIYQGEFKIYCSKEVEKNLRMFAKATLAKKHLACLDREIIFEQIQDGDKKQILGMEVTFLDIHSAKAEQYGFCLKTLNGKKLFFAGDEPMYEGHREFAWNADWLLHEAFCMEEEAALYKPYEKHHSTARDAAKTAECIRASNLVLWHTEDDHIEDRKRLYEKEAALEFQGNIVIPDDLEKILL